MDITVIVALIGLIGVGASALIQYFLSGQREKNKNMVEIQTQAYLDFINAVSDIASSAKHNKARTLEELQKLTQAKSRMILIGSDDVVKEAHRFFTEFQALDDKESFKAFSKVVLAMRLDLAGSNSLSSKVVLESLFGKRH